MPNDQSLFDLYSEKILALAASLSSNTDIPEDLIMAKARSPLCGSYITVGISVKDDKIEHYVQNVKACALGQASAAIFEQVVTGQTRATLETARAELMKMLAAGDEPPSAPFEGYEILRPAQEFSNRHASIMLPFTATLDAFSRAEGDA